MSKLLGYMAAGIVVGLLFFGVLILMIVGGLQEPIVWRLIACGAGAVFATAYVRRARQIRRDGTSGKDR